MISEALSQQIRDEIMQAGGTLSFARFMELALYAPGLGYYSAGSHKLGKEGDFITAPEISPLFAQCIATQCQLTLSALSGGDILEFGAGSGVFAKDLLLELEKLESLPDNYFILEISADLRERQFQLLSHACPHLLSRIHWLDTLPTQQWRGIMFANEVLDAMPVNCFALVDNQIIERGVAWENEEFTWRAMTPDPALKEHVTALLQECALPNEYQSEANLRLSAWVRTVTEKLEQGMVLLIDYGYGRREYYHPERTQGTLTCFYQHRRHDNPLTLVGLQDITAHVDFTTVAESGLAAGLMLAGYTTQASFLLGCGLLERSHTLDAVDTYRQAQAIKTLTLPSEMGEVVKVMGLTKNLTLALPGFYLQDRRRDL